MGLAVPWHNQTLPAAPGRKKYHGKFYVRNFVLMLKHDCSPRPAFLLQLHRWI